MSEEEIIKIIKEYLSKEYIECTKIGAVSIPNEEWYAIHGLLDLYSKEKETSHFLQSELDRANAKLLEEKEKNKKLIQGQVKTLDEILQPELLKKYISKDKIRKIIRGLDKRVIENSEIDYFAYLTVGEALSFKHFLEKELLEEE